MPIELSATRQCLLQYYKDLEKYVIHYYNKQLNRINYILKQYVGFLSSLAHYWSFQRTSQGEGWREGTDEEWNKENHHDRDGQVSSRDTICLFVVSPAVGFSREKIVNLKEKIRQMNIEAGALAIRKVNDAHDGSSPENSFCTFSYKRCTNISRKRFDRTCKQRSIICTKEKIS